MRYSKRDRTKIIVLAVVLVALWGFIGIKFGLLSKQHKARARAQALAQAAGQPQATQGPGVGGVSAQGGSPALRLAALVAPVPPPKSDPFRPLIAPRRSEGGSAQPPATTRRPPEPESASGGPPLLPPMPGSESSYRGGRDQLQLTGIILGTPSTAVLRLGDDHFVVKEGDLVDSTLRVQKIAKTTVTLRDGRTAYTLRLGG